jgi:(p)ppGpp synthase/HD superfamily hydrolase
VTQQLSSYEKQKIALRYWLYSAKYYRAVTAMDFAEKYHQGVRKDGITPEFSHQIAIASHVRCFADLLEYPEETICAALLHDVREDYGVSDEETRGRFGDLVADAVDALTKEFRGVRRDEATVFAAIAGNVIASVVKPADRIHNHGSMMRVFSVAKMTEYTNETREYFWKMIKTARRTFPSQEPIYEALSLVLSTQLDFADALCDALREDVS